MGKYRNASENLRATFEESTGNIKKAAKEAGSIAAKTVEDVKDKVNELTESTEKKVSAVKKTVKDASEKKSTASKTGRKPAAKKEKAALAKNVKEKLTFEFTKHRQSFSFFAYMKFH